jgi:uncharacterized protein (TIGR02145 family)
MTGKHKIGEPLHGGIIIANNLIASLRTRKASWEDAMDSPPGWRLPTQEELHILYEAVPNTTGFYWSSTEYNARDAWAQSFDDGWQGFYDKGYIYSARAVRSFE